ncbi:hypothetical protein JCM10049v2_001035 [Rhodotorula toruloides]
MGAGHYLEAGVQSAQACYSVSSELFGRSRAIVETPSLIFGNIVTMTEADGLKYALGKAIEFGTYFDTVRLIVEGSCKYQKADTRTKQAQARLNKDIPLEAKSKEYRIYKMLGQVLEQLEPDVPREERKYLVYHGRGEGEHTAYLAYDIALQEGYGHSKISVLTSMNTDKARKRAVEEGFALQSSPLRTADQLLRRAVDLDEARTEQHVEIVRPEETNEAIEPPKAAFLFARDGDVLNGPCHEFYSLFKPLDDGQILIKAIDSNKARDHAVATIRRDPQEASFALASDEAATTDQRPMWASGIGGFKAAQYYLVSDGDIEKVHELILQHQPEYPDLDALSRSVIAYTAYLGLPASAADARHEQRDPDTGLSTLQYGYYVSPRNANRRLLLRVLDQRKVPGSGLSPERLWAAAVADGLVPVHGFSVTSRGTENLALRQTQLGTGKPGTPFGLPFSSDLITSDDYLAIGCDASKHEISLDDLPALVNESYRLERRAEAREEAIAVREREEIAAEIRQQEEEDAAADSAAGHSTESPAQDRITAVHRAKAGRHHAEGILQYKQLAETLLSRILAQRASASPPPIDVSVVGVYYQITSGDDIVASRLSRLPDSASVLRRIRSMSDDVFTTYGIDLDTLASELGDVDEHISAAIRRVAQGLAEMCQYPVLGPIFKRALELVNGGGFLLEQTLSDWILRTDFYVWPLPFFVRRAREHADKLKQPPLPSTSSSTEESSSIISSADLPIWRPRKNRGMHELVAGQRRQASEALPEAADAWLSDPRNLDKLRVYYTTSIRAKDMSGRLRCDAVTRLIECGLVDSESWYKSPPELVIEEEKAQKALDVIKEQRAKLGLAPTIIINHVLQPMLAIAQDFFDTIYRETRPDDEPDKTAFLGGAVESTLTVENSRNVEIVWWRSYWNPEVTLQEWRVDIAAKKLQEVDEDAEELVEELRSMPHDTPVYLAKLKEWYHVLKLPKLVDSNTVEVRWRAIEARLLEYLADGAPVPSDKYERSKMLGGSLEMTMMGKRALASWCKLGETITPRKGENQSTIKGKRSVEQTPLRRSARTSQSNLAPEKSEEKGKSKELATSTSDADADEASSYRQPPTSSDRPPKRAKTTHAVSFNDSDIGPSASSSNSSPYNSAIKANPVITDDEIVERDSGYGSSR